MKRKVFLFCIIVLLAMVSNAWAADVNGKWVAKIAGTPGQYFEITLTFKADGAKVTGTLNNSTRPGDVEIQEGKIEGDNISFSLMRSTGQSDIKVVWKGTVSGDEIKFTRSFEGGMGSPGGGVPSSLEIIAKKVK